MKKLELFGLLIASLLLSASTWPQSKQPKLTKTVENEMLRPSAKYWDYVDPHPIVHTSRLSRNRRLASIGDTVYMLNAHNKIIWTWTSKGPPLTDLPIIDSTGTSTFWDTTCFGPQSIPTQAARNGEYGKWTSTLFSDKALSTGLLLSGHRHVGVQRESSRSIKDNLTLCRGNTILWDTEIPALAQIQVSGKRVFVIYSHKKRLVRVPLNIPLHLSKPREKSARWRL